MKHVFKVQSEFSVQGTTKNVVKDFKTIFVCSIKCQEDHTTNVPVLSIVIQLANEMVPGGGGWAGVQI